LRLLFIRWHPSSRVGGLAVNTERLMLELANRGHQVAELTALLPALTRPWVERGVRLTASRLRPVRRDHGSVGRFRAAVPEAALPSVLSAIRPDAVIVNSGGAWRRDWAQRMLTAARRWPTVLYVYDRASVELGAGSPQAGRELVAISEFVAASLGERETPVTVIVPVIDRVSYRVPTARRAVLFINPTENKGVDIALGLAAARPDVPFEFVGGERRSLRKLPALPNITYRAWTDDPAALFGAARVLLVPSRYPEAWPRVVGEAQASAIPALAADVGGMREAVGDGGRLVPSDAPGSIWTAALGSLWDDEAVYAEQSAAAEREGQRSTLRPEDAAQRLEVVVARAIRRRV
jgi:glycosyltransferase involved in cell wall biosynthesis